MRANRTDKRHAISVHCLRLLGASVQGLTKVKDGCPDLLVGYGGIDGTIELKTDDDKPNELQVKWHASWKGRPVLVVQVPEDYSEQEVLTVFSEILRLWVQRRPKWLKGGTAH